MMALVIVQNRNLLAIPRITPLHIIFARAALEVIIAILVCVIFYGILLLIGAEFAPDDIYSVAMATFCAIYIGVSLGMVNIVAVSLFGFGYIVFFYLVMLIFLLSSGAYFPVHYSTGVARDLIDINPLFHVVNWFRSAYYVDGSSIPFDPFYLWSFGSVCLFLGLAGERFLRGKILAP